MYIDFGNNSYFICYCAMARQLQRSSLCGLIFPNMHDLLGFASMSALPKSSINHPHNHTHKKHNQYIMQFYQSTYTVSYHTRDQYIMGEKRYVLIFSYYTRFHGKYLQVCSCACIMSFNDAREFESYRYISIYSYYCSQICRFVKSVHIMQVMLI